MSTVPPRDDLVALYENHTDDEIALLKGVSSSTVRRWRRHHVILSKSTGPRTGRPSVKVSDDQIRQVIPDCYSVAEVCRLCGLSETGQGHRTMKTRIAQLGLDTQHFGTKKAAVLGHAGKHMSLEVLLTKGVKRAAASLKARLLREGILVAQCSACGLGSGWNGAPLVHHLDHVDGDTTNNSIENLRLLCPNCHSQTPTYAGRNIAKKMPT